MKKTINHISYIIFIISVLHTTSFAQTDNYVLGTNAGVSITTGDFNTHIGIRSGFSNSTGSNNITVAYQSGYSLTSGYKNIFLGGEAGFYTTSGYRNIMIGYRAGYRNTIGARNIFIGEDSGFLNTTGFYNTFIGNKAGPQYGTGVDVRDNLCIGRNAGISLTDGEYNCVVGAEGPTNFWSAGEFLDGGFYNTGLGSGSLSSCRDGNNNTTIGTESGTELYNASDNTFVGFQSGWYNNRVNLVGKGERNTYIGKSTGYHNEQGNDNVGMGANADVVVPTGNLYATFNNAVFIGASASVAADGITIVGHQTTASGANGIAIGKESSATASNAIAIGYQAMAFNANEVVIGNASHTSIGGHVNWTATSDGRLKTNIQENVVGLDFINQLRPVTYQFAVGSKQYADSLKTANCHPDSYREPTVFTGFIAQEVEQAAQNVNFDFSGVDKPQNENDFYGLRYAEFVVPLTKSVQELSVKNEQLKAEKAQYEAILEAALLRLEALENQKSAIVKQ